MRRRALLHIPLLAALPFLFLGWNGLRDFNGEIPIGRIPKGRPFEVVVMAGEATLTLPGDPDAGYRVIFGSLGEPGAHWPIQLTMDSPSGGAQRAEASIRPLPPLSSKRLPFDDSAPTTLVDSDVASTAELEHTGEEREFWLHVTAGPLEDPAQYTKVRARPVVRGRRTRIYMDLQARAETAGSLALEIAQACDDLIPRLEADYGPIRDVDGDGTLAVLITPWLNALQGGSTSVGGFVRSSDFRGETAAPFSNRADVLFLNSEQTSGQPLRTLLAHELTHAATISSRLAGPRRRIALPDDEDWISEGLAHLSENRYGGWSNLDHRLARFLRETGRYPLAVPDYYRAGLWRNHGCRGATWLFHRWCCDEFGPEYASRVAVGSGRGVPNVEQATGQPFPELFRHWSVAMFQPRHPEKQPSNDERLAERTEGRCGRFELDGPRILTLADVAESGGLMLASTAVAAVDIPPSRDRRVLTISAPVDAKLQATLIRLPGHQLTLTAGTDFRVGLGETAAGTAQSPKAINIAWNYGSLGDNCSIEAVRIERFTLAGATELSMTTHEFPAVAEPANSAALIELSAVPVMLRRRYLGRNAGADEPWLATVRIRDSHGRIRRGWQRIPATDELAPSTLASRRPAAGR